MRINADKLINAHVCPWASEYQRTQHQPQLLILNGFSVFLLISVLGKHHFSEHWEGSDVILVVENEKFHVHRQMLSLHSPVFKAMLNSAMFKEATAKEIPSPEKNADEILDFLNILYLKERDAITCKYK